MGRIKLFSLGAAGLLAVGVLAACGGGGAGGDEDPQQVLDETFSGDKDVTSGVIDFFLNAGGQSNGQDASFDVSFGGPFQDMGEGQLPAFDFSFEFTVESPDQNASFDGAATSTGDRGFLTFMGTTYEVDSEILDSFTQGFEDAQAQSGSEGSADDLQALGIDPRGWLTNLTNEGTEDVEGAETIHISGEANVPQIVEDLTSAAEQAGNQVPAPLPTDQLSQIQDAIQEARIDVFTGVDDRILRRLALTFAIDVPEGVDSGGGNLDGEFSVTLSQLNEEQTIEAPADAQPLSDLLGQLGIPAGPGGIPGLGDLGVGGGSAPPPPDAPQVPEDIPDAAIPEDSQAYLDCIAGATSPSEIQDCAEQFVQ